MSRKSGALTYPEPLGPPRPVAGDLYLFTEEWGRANALYTRIFILEDFWTKVHTFVIYLLASSFLRFNSVSFSMVFV
jgi:hypothetical protein